MLLTTMDRVTVGPENTSAKFNIEKINITNEYKIPYLTSLSNTIRMGLFINAMYNALN